MPYIESSCQECGIKILTNGVRKYCSTKCATISHEKMRASRFVAKYGKTRTQIIMADRKIRNVCLSCNKNKGNSELSRCTPCSIRHKEALRGLRIEVFNYYGNTCACCGEDEFMFLAIDHINNDGAKHRKENKLNGGYHFYRWLKKNNFPEGFQTLCHNCNMAKSFYGQCPHITKKLMLEVA